MKKNKNRAALEFITKVNKQQKVLDKLKKQRNLIDITFLTIIVVLIGLIVFLAICNNCDFYRVIFE